MSSTFVLLCVDPRTGLVGRVARSSVHVGAEALCSGSACSAILPNVEQQHRDTLGLNQIRTCVMLLYMYMCILFNSHIQTCSLALHKAHKGNVSRRIIIT